MPVPTLRLWELRQLRLSSLNSCGSEHHLEVTISRSTGPRREGTDIGLPPLAYFIAGAASCLMTQCAKLAIAKDVPLKSMRAVARGIFDGNRESR
jgi:uncharacterized OsmC-like protein